MGKGISTAEGRLNLGTEVPYVGSPPLHVEVMTKLDQPNISKPFRQRSTGQNHCAETLVPRNLIGYAELAPHLRGKTQCDGGTSWPAFS